MDIYYARSENSDGEKETAEHHLHRAGELCREFLEPIGYGEWGRVLGETHDFGKYSPLFAQVLCHSRVHVNHAMPGAALVYVLYAGKKKTRQLLGSVIAAHHSRLSSLPDRKVGELLKGEGNRQDENGYTYSLYGQKEIKTAFDLWGKDFSRITLNAPPDFGSTQDPSLSKMLFMRFLYSALIDADWSSSAEHYQPEYLRLNSGRTFEAPEALDNLRRLVASRRAASSSAAELNALRDELLDNCLRAAEREPGIYTLTAPTGLGKTLSLFAFAAKHCQVYGKRRVVLVLPFLSIIEQNAKDYRTLVPDLLEIHSSITFDEQTRLLSSRWAAPCIVTTNIGLLEPLFSAESSSCRHLHQLADSVIVLDEAQSLPVPLLRATIHTLQLLCEQYGCTVVLSTATQPSYEFLSGLQWKPAEIVEDPDRMFGLTRRVQYDWRIQEPEPFDEIAEEVSSFSQVCTIVNLKRHAREMYRLEKTALGEDNLFYITTDLCPAHRTAVLEEVRRRLESGLPCCLIATQCIEAGVDLDFPVLYRALAPLDSIIQAAGRCNRNGAAPDGKVVVFYPQDRGTVYPQGDYYEAGALCVKELAARHPIDCSSRQHIREYYELLFSRSEGDNPKLQKAIDLENFAAVEEEYRLIHQEGVSVIVPYEGERRLYEEIRDSLDKEGLTNRLIQKARPITVTSYDRQYVEMHCEKLYYYSVESQDSKLPSGFFLLGNPALYDAKLGFAVQREEPDLML